MDFKEYLEVSRKKLKTHLKSYFQKRKDEKVPQLFKEQKYIDELESFVLKGKLLRGTLFLFTIESLGKEIRKEHLDIACAIELMHSALLIQDDIIDNDYKRRGSKTIFAKYEEFGKEIKAFNPYHYGISSGIVVADVAFFYAIDLLSNFKGEVLSKLIKQYAQEVYMVVLAEGADSIFGQTEKEPDKSEIDSVYLYKTARYTFSLPFELGVMVVGESNSLKSNLGKLGELVGIIFQIKDDEIGLFGDEGKIGKPVGSDIRENKKTLLRYYLFKKAKDNKKMLDNIFGNPKIGEREIDYVKSLYQKLNIQTDINYEIENIMNDVWVIYKSLPLKKEYKNILKGLLEFNISRSS